MNIIIETILVLGLMWVALPAMRGFTEGLREQPQNIQNDTTLGNDVKILPQTYNNVSSDVKSAMKNMGFKKGDIDNAVECALKENNGATIQGLLKASLKKAIV